jgi:Fibronectin type III-like domain
LARARLRAIIAHAQRRPGAAVPRDIRKLKAFERVRLEPGERRTVTFDLDLDLTGLPDLSGLARPRRPDDALSKAAIESNMTRAESEPVPGGFAAGTCCS